MGHLPKSRLMRRSSALETSVGLRRRLLRLELFLVRIWLLYALKRRTFPLPVTRKRLAALLLVFIFAMVFVFPLADLLTRCQNHRHITALEQWLTLDPSHIVYGLCRSEEHTSELQSRGHLVCRLL